MNSSFDSIQKTHWSKVRSNRFEWQTVNPFVSAQEKKILSVLNSLKGKTILEVGSGEGPNLANITKKYKKYGIDYSESLVAFARSKVKDAIFSCQDATKLKFPDNSFDIVFCRDLLHHVRERSALLNEMLRVCKPKGTVVLIESNGLNPLIFIFSLVHPAEYGVRFITPAYLKRLLKKYHITSWNYAEPFSLWRFIFHYQYGFSSTAKYRIIQKCYNLFEKFMYAILPKKMWGYIIIQLYKDT